MAENLNFVSVPPKPCNPSDTDNCGEVLEKKAEFGTRFLDNPGRVYEHNAWDDVEWSEAQIEEAEKKIALNSSSFLPSHEVDQQYANSSKSWHAFYQQHHENFFKDRNWLLSSFPELATTPPSHGPIHPQSKIDAQEQVNSTVELTSPVLSIDIDTYLSLHLCSEASTATVRILDAGCGVGNSSFPILESNPSPDLFIYACDFAESAIDLIKANPQYNSKRIHPFVCDLSSDNVKFPFPPNSFHFILLLFVLSAVPPSKACLVTKRLSRLLQPGGMLLFRDYGRYDMTQLRFKLGTCLQPNCYRRGDGTQAYFFTEQEVSQLFEQEAGLERVQLISDKRLQVNRGKQIKMFRVWIQAICSFLKIQTIPNKMTGHELFRVCEDCFNAQTNPPTLEKIANSDGSCRTCGRMWSGISVAYYAPHRKWYRIRNLRHEYKLYLCPNKISGRCFRGVACRRAHNILELEIWTAKEKRPDKPRFSCVICDNEFPSIENLNAHMMSEVHKMKTKSMRILPEVGHSARYSGPIRARPKLVYGSHSYEMCRYKRCRFYNACKNAHSHEEQKVWIDALQAETNKHPDQNHSGKFDSFNYSSLSSKSDSYNYSSSGGYSSSQGASRYPSSSDSRPQWISENTVTEPDCLQEVYRAIDNFGLKACILPPDYIRMECSTPVVVNVGESNENQSLLTLQSTQPEFLNSIVLYQHKGIFTLGDIFKCNKEGGIRERLKHPHNANRTNYLIFQAFDSDNFFELAIICKPQIGEHRVHVIFQLQDGLLLAKEICVKPTGDEFKEVRENFMNTINPVPTHIPVVPSVPAHAHIPTQPVPARGRTPVADSMLPVNWELNYTLLNTSWYSNKHPMRIDIEDKIRSGFFQNMKSEITKDKYAVRFHQLLFIEEYQHKKSLMKYDLPNQKITFENVDRQVTIEIDNDRELVETARGNYRFIKFELKHRLFEGYRSFRPPKAAYIIPNGMKRAYHCTSINLASEYIILTVTTELIKDCQTSGGLAFVRFIPDRDEFVMMHEALDNINLSVVFPVLRKVDIPWSYIDEDHLVKLLDYERILSDSQKDAVFSIINLECHSFPTILCGPFGSGKTRTLSVAARLISRAFRRSRVLIVTKTNSCANLYVELLQDYFDSISVLREGGSEHANRKIIFRHFAKSQNVNWNRRVNRFANIENQGYPDAKYKSASLYDIQQCSIVVTTLTACHTLVSAQDFRKSKSLFTHIFIDEAAQVTEPEVLIALSLASTNTKVVLAGDVRQSKPLILSHYGKKYDLDQSLMERFELLPEYEGNILKKCKVNLTENFRSRRTIVNFFSELFYDSCIVAKPPRLTGPTNFPALSFIHVSGQENSLQGYPSYYNEEEAQLTIRALRKLVAAGVRVTKIAVLTTFKAQDHLINEVLRKEGINCMRRQHSPKYCREHNCINHITIEHKKLEAIQGREYDMIIINTVRTVTHMPESIESEEMLDFGLMDDVAQFNTILTRARGWILVIGDVDCLTTLGRCSNVWTKYVEACSDVCGYFESIQEFDNFDTKIPYQKKYKKPSRIQPREQQEEVIVTQESIPSSQVITVEEPKISATYNSKLNSLQMFINSCHEELNSLTNQDIINVINEQLEFTNITIELMERQSLLESKSSKTVSSTGLLQGAAPMSEDQQGATPQVPPLPQDLIPEKEYSNFI
ncbi:Methyltransferase-like protein 2A isoform X1 [Oopsacas minuta]|uniref:Methyltransferase-like protein 2A isoform X1 n=1 Tax=Oopsacas minuta TaxID=111878 RepID=A0AAV7JHX4_9METZ|nr:Methyltransferase-like protein 2A isoform X1 [Oopsacas minuta]